VSMRRLLKCLSLLCLTFPPCELDLLTCFNLIPINLILHACKASALPLSYTWSGVLHFSTAPLALILCLLNKLLIIIGSLSHHPGGEKAYSESSVVNQQTVSGSLWSLVGSVSADQEAL
jgi:hypothetical protein